MDLEVLVLLLLESHQPNVKIGDCGCQQREKGKEREWGEGDL